MNLNNRQRFFFLVFIVLGVYYSTIFGGANYIDDVKMMAEVSQMSAESLWQLFIPGGLYYRPLLVLSFYMDHLLWDMTPSFMLFENILLHLGNTLMVFVIASRIYVAEPLRKAEIPLLSALLFAVHPINTESINWISGRTDPLATFFILLSLIVLIAGIDRKRLAIVFLSTLVLCLGAMVKEVAVAFFPAAFVLAWVLMRDEHHTALSGRDRRKILLVFSSPFLVAFLGYFSLRLFASAGGDVGLADAFASNPYDLWDTIRVVFKSFGFYVKKLFVPVPLNFAIVKANDGYVVLGLAALCSLLFFVWKRLVPLAFLAVSFFVISPALIVPFMQQVWTPLAERYLYMPSAFFCLGIVAVLFLLLQRFQLEKYTTVIVALALLPATWVTADRNMIWQDQVLLFEDTVAKSPEFSTIRNELALALIDQGELDKAQEQLATGLTLRGGKGNANIYINKAWVLMDQKKYYAARDVLLETFTEMDQAHPKILAMLAKVDQQIIFEMKSAEEKRPLWEEVIEIYEALHAVTGDPFHLYLAGKTALSLNDTKRAGAYFAIVAEKAPADAFYAAPARKMAGKFSAQIGAGRE